MRERPVFEPYTDAFNVACHFPVGLKRGDGSTMPCLEPGRFRVLFPSGARCMVCPTHKATMEAQYSSDGLCRPGAKESEERVLFDAWFKDCGLVDEYYHPAWEGWQARVSATAAGLKVADEDGAMAPGCRHSVPLAHPCNGCADEAAAGGRPDPRGRL